MTDTWRLHLKAQGAALGAGAIGVVAATVWPGGLVGALMFLAAWALGIYVVLAYWGWFKLGRHLRTLEEADAVTAREAFFSRYPWLAEERRDRKQANSTQHTDARGTAVPDQPPSARAGERGR